MAAPNTSATMTAAMRQFIIDFPQMSTVAILRDTQARNYFEKTTYDLYEQGSYKIIKRRAEARAAGAPATFTP